MGASLSNTTENASATGGRTGLGDMPESCVACVFMYLTPPEICNLARLNCAFRGAASSDAVWESKLPCNYRQMLDLLPPWRYDGLPKKGIFALLSRPVPFDDDNKLYTMSLSIAALHRKVLLKTLAFLSSQIAYATSAIAILKRAARHVRPLALVINHCTFWFQLQLDLIWHRGQCCSILIPQLCSLSLVGSLSCRVSHRLNTAFGLAWFCKIKFFHGTGGTSCNCDWYNCLVVHFWCLQFWILCKVSLDWMIFWEVWLDRVSGRICLSISSKAMSITGSEDRRHWNWFPTEESRFHVVAYCQQVWWFEVSGIVKFPFPPDIYTLTFRIHLGNYFKRLGRRVPNFEHTHGWDLGPVRYELSTSDGQHAVSECFLHEVEQDAKKRGCWIEYKVGEFIVNRYREMLQFSCL